MRILSKLVFLCNICFLISIVLRLVELNNHKNGIHEPLLRLNPLENTLVVLGYGAIFINFVFVVIVLVRLAFKKYTLPHWITIFNAVILIIQFIYFLLNPSNAINYN